MIELFDRIMQDDRLSGADLRVGWALLRHVNQETGRTWPSVNRLSQKCHLAKRSVQRSLKRLEDSGWYKLIESGGGDKSKVWMPNVLALDPPTNSSSATPESPVADTSPATCESAPCDSGVAITLRRNTSSEASLRSASAADAPTTDVPGHQSTTDGPDTDQLQHAYSATNDAFSELRKEIRNDVLDKITDEQRRAVAHECLQTANGTALDMRTFATRRLIQIADDIARQPEFWSMR